MNKTLRKAIISEPEAIRISEDQAAILRFLKQRPATPVELATHFKVSRQVIHYQLQGLYKYGVLDKPKHILDAITLPEG